MTCVVTGLRPSSDIEKKYIFSEGARKEVKNISPYLIDSPNVFATQRTSPISNLPKMILGSSGFDGGHLMVSKEERDRMLSEYPVASKFIRQFMSGDDFLNSKIRFCLWIDDSEIEEAMTLPTT